MSKLPNAPLIEVIFELRWNVSDKQELGKCQYLHGDLFALIKSDFNYREALIAPEVPMELYQNVPAHRFRFAQNEYPLVQVGPGLLTLNTTDSKYIWNDFKSQIDNVISKFLEVYQFDEKQKISLILQYFDFFEFDFESANVHEFLKNKLKISVEQEFYANISKPNNLNLSFHYKTEFGQLTITIFRGQNNAKDGIVMQTNITSDPIQPDLNVISIWLNNSQKFCSQLFKDMTKGTLYESFNVAKK